MKLLMKRRLSVAVLAAVCVLAALFAAIPTWSSPGVPEYDLWCDVNNDGRTDIKDILMVAKQYGATGQNLTKASIQYDSGWLDITDKRGQNIIVTHGLNSSDLIVDITGKATIDGGAHQRHLGLTGFTAGWNKTYGGTGGEWAWALVETVDGGYALAGGTESYGAGSGDFWLVKTDSAGNAQWNKTYGGTFSDYARALVETVDGGYALAGTTSVSSVEFGLVKTDSAGNVQWNKTYGGAASDFACALVETVDGGYALAGLTLSYGAGSGDFWLVKTDSAGDAQWNKTYGGTGGEWARALVETVDGGYALAGQTGSFGAGSGDFWLVKTDSAGDAQWNKTYGGTGTDRAFALVATVDGGYALAGQTGSFGAGSGDFWLVKTDATGNALWNRTYGGTGEDYAYALVQTSDGGYALAGNGFANLVKTDASGNMQWNMSYEGEAQALVQTGDGGYALAGDTGYYGDFWLVKTDVETGFTYGLSWVDSTADSITLYRGSTDPYWNYVRVRLWKPRNTP
jgi:hypothetical protein